MNFKTICSNFGNANIHTDEDYLRILRRRQRLFIGMLIVGLLTSAITGIAELLELHYAMSPRQFGFYCGVGGGLTGGAIVFLLRNYQAMRDPEKLRQARIKETDERMQDISRRALAVAGYALLLAVYLTCLIGGIFYPELLMILAGLACVFLITYVISFFIYNKMM